MCRKSKEMAAKAKSIGWVMLNNDINTQSTKIVYIYTIIWYEGRR